MGNIPTTDISFHASGANDLITITIRADSSLSNSDVCDILYNIITQLGGGSDRDATESSGRKA